MEPIQDLRVKLNAETGKLSWPELQPHFARGVVVKVARGLDLVDVAARFAADDKAAVERWLMSGEIARASTDDAAAWVERAPIFWAVVAVPWVLVQEVTSSLQS